MPQVVVTVSDTSLIRVASFVTAPRPAGNFITWAAWSDDDPSDDRLASYGLLVVGCENQAVPRLFPFFTVERQTVWSAGAWGFTTNPSSFNGYYSLLFQPNENAVGQVWTLNVGPD